MNVRFIAPNPSEPARSILDDILNRGADQISIACAFLTGGGVEVLRRHTARLQRPSSFVVVAWSEPTDLAALNELHALMPGNLYIHLGVKTPVERGVGRGLMHSKVFFARERDRCWLWTGSHNLTASAVLGVNREAAVILEGSFDEQPFQDAVAHLDRCKAEAVVFDPLDPPPPLTPEQTLVVHAECGVPLKTCPWFVHLRAATTDYDKAMRPPGAVWLYLYEPGTLVPRGLRPAPIAAYSGRLTALNFTESHPRDRGIPADWINADFVIEQSGGVFRLTEPTPHSSRTPTQGVFRVEARENPTVIWLTEKPSQKHELILGETHFEHLDPDLRPFFTGNSVVGDRLVHREYRELRPVYRLPQKEVANLDKATLSNRLKVSPKTQIELIESPPKDEKFDFIYRAQYRA